MKTIMWIYPIWIGIIFNLLLTFFNVAMIGKGHGNQFMYWYFERKGGPIIMGVAWMLFITWTIANYLWM